MLGSTWIANVSMRRSIVLINIDGAVTWLCYVSCNEGANDALKVFIEMFTTKCIIRSYLIASWLTLISLNYNVCHCDCKEGSLSTAVDTQSWRRTRLFATLKRTLSFVRIKIFNTLNTVLKGKKLKIIMLLVPLLCAWKIKENLQIF